jgi:asparagine synthase (glutamine-hydrolysing)
MCGLAGFWGARPDSDLARHAAGMAAALTSRGPDDSGVWTDRRVGLALSHRRLAILELSDAGSQPMISACGNLVLVFNGEIYNHAELRQTLERESGPIAWRGHADTETLLACFSAWGVERTLTASNGMFALALWNGMTRVLTLARDRAGEKPLYWGWHGNMLLFGSELKALRAHPAFQAEIDRDALALLLRHSYISAPYCIYRNIQKLRAGHYLNIPLGDLSAAKAAASSPYWRMNDVIRSGLENPLDCTPDEAIDLLERQLTLGIRSQMQADVPLGAFLSSGVDSSTIVALMQKQSTRPVRTFTVGFPDASCNEAVHAKAIARHLGSDHTEIYLQPADALAVIPSLAQVYDEPFADSSQIPTILVSRLARQHVKVALSGDAGDELFGGYNTYRFVPALWQRISRIPLPLRRFAACGMSSLPAGGWDAVLAAIRRFSSQERLSGATGERIHRLAELLPCARPEDFYHSLSSHWKRPGEAMASGQEPQTLLNSPEAWPEVDNMEHWMMALNAQMYMSDDILTKVDRASMTNSLEVRVPMLDHRIIALAWRLPLDLKIRNGKGKWILREVLKRHVPPELTDHPKMGFSIPLADWLRGPLRGWAEALLDAGRLASEGYLNPRAVRNVWETHLSGKRDYATKLWCVLMFQAWLEQEQSHRQ